MKNQRIPEHKLNTTNTVGQAIENITNNDLTATSSAEKINKQNTNKAK
ncbi:hypothetical protein [Neobacillus bataviensis]|nr:hypothetical protein [Neobacillus bataviensis]